MDAQKGAGADGLSRGRGRIKKKLESGRAVRVRRGPRREAAGTRLNRVRSCGIAGTCRGGMTGLARGDEPGRGHAWMHKRGRTRKPEKGARKHKGEQSPRGNAAGRLRRKKAGADRGETYARLSGRPAGYRAGADQARGGKKSPAAASGRTGAQNRPKTGRGGAEDGNGAEMRRHNRPGFGGAGAGRKNDGFRGAARTKPRRGPGKTGCENPAAHLSRPHAGRWSAARGKRGRALAGRKEIVYNFQ